MPSGTWYAPKVTGDVPPPCYGFSLLNIDDYSAVMFGGFVGSHLSNDVYYLNLRTWVSDGNGVLLQHCMCMILWD